MFDINYIEHNYKKATSYLQGLPFYKFICQDIIDRLGGLNNNSDRILLIKPILENFFVNELKEKYSYSQLSSLKSIEQIEYVKDQFDLIIFPFGMHFISDVQNFLKQIHTILAPAGIFICNFPGGNSLGALRRKLIGLEQQFTKAYVPHILPFIQFEHMNPLLMQAGFTENVMDIENIEIEYDTPLLLMKALKQAGQSNCIKGAISYSITKGMYRSLDSENAETFIDRMDLISFVSCKTKGTIKLLKEHFYN